MLRIARVVIPGIPHHITQIKYEGDANLIYFQNRYIGRVPIPFRLASQSTSNLLLPWLGHFPWQAVLHPLAGCDYVTGWNKGMAIIANLYFFNQPVSVV
jgi:hypothetical protein